MAVRVAIDGSVHDLAVGVVEAIDIPIQHADMPLQGHCRHIAQQIAHQGADGGDRRRNAVRQLLRGGGFKPSGRNKPAQEYLLRVARAEDAWPTILNVVDVLNIVSLQSGLPISLISLKHSEVELLLRYGEAGEQFVFNQSGQVLQVGGLVCLCARTDTDSTVPLGTPVKDSQQGKVTLRDRHVVACLYAPRSAVSPSSLQHWTGELSAGWRTWCGASSIHEQLVPEQW